MHIVQHQKNQVCEMKKNETELRSQNNDPCGRMGQHAMRPHGMLQKLEAPGLSDLCGRIESLYTTA